MVRYCTDQSKTFQAKIWLGLGLEVTVEVCIEVPHWEIVPSPHVNTHDIDDIV